MNRNSIRIVETTTRQDETRLRQSDADDQALALWHGAAAAGDGQAAFDLGVAHATGSHGLAVDLIEAHKWFNLAALSGIDEAAACRADMADDMTAREIAEAQRRAREWLRRSGTRRVA